MTTKLNLVEKGRFLPGRRFCLLPLAETVRITNSVNIFQSPVVFCVAIPSTLTLPHSHSRPVHTVCLYSCRCHAGWSSLRRQAYVREKHETNVVRVIDWVFPVSWRKKTKQTTIASFHIFSNSSFAIIVEYVNLFYLCKILGIHSGDYEECRLLGRGAV
jgi:hypothetical protein